MISVIIPTRNSGSHLARTFAPLIAGVADGVVKQAIVADAGSSDDTLAVAEAAGCDVVAVSGNRARQLIEGAKAARGEWFLILHPGTVLTPAWLDEVKRFIARPGAQSRAATFRFAFDDDAPEARRVVSWARLRGEALKLPGGEQGLLISRRLYDILGGYANMDAMEDVDLVRRIGGKRLTVLGADALVCAEKYQRDGYTRHAWREQVALARYLMGADPGDLAKVLEPGA
ncbi:MAG: glycosyltransferase [Alphaproteobacteria bacterium]